MEKRTRWPPHLTESADDRPAHAPEGPTSAPSRASQPAADSQVVGWILGISLVGLLLFGPGFYEWARLSLMQRRLDRRLAELAAQHEQLEREHERLQSDATYLEGLIRSTFKLAQPGELVVPLDPDPHRQ